MKTDYPRTTAALAKDQAKAILARAAEPMTRAGFLQTINLLAESPCRKDFLHDGSNREKTGVWSTLVSCPYEVWERFFGEPEAAVQYEDDLLAEPLQMWQQPCSDGLVECIGHLFDRPRQGRWVIVARICCA